MSDEPSPSPEAFSPEELPIALASRQGWTPRPLLGPILWVFGVALWAFVVLGQFTTTRAPWSSKVPLGGEAAAFWLCALWLGALVHALRTSLTIPMSQRWGTPSRVAVVTIATLLLWLFTLITATAFASASSSRVDGLMTIGLMGLGVTTTVLGRAASCALRPPPQGRARTVAFALWSLAGLFSFLAILQLG